MTALIIEGIPELGQLEDIWNTIYDSFIEKMQDENQKYIQKLSMDYNLLNTKCTVIDTLIKALRYMYRIEFAEELNRWYGMQITLNPKNKEEYARQLSLIEARTKRWLSDSAGIKREMDLLTPVANDVEISREYFDQTIVAISRFSKYHVNKKETTVGEFIAMIQDMRAAAKQIESFSQN